MSLSAGTFSKKFGSDRWWKIPPSVLYREWRINRAWYLLAFAVMVIAWVLPWMGEIFSDYFVSGIRQIVSEYPFLPPFALPVVNSAVMGILAVMIFQNDWERGRLGRALDGPVRRSDILSAKLGLLLGTIVASTLVVFIGMVIFAAMVSHSGQIGYIASWALLEATMESAIAILTLATGTAISNPIFVGMATAIWVTVPRIASGILAAATMPPIQANNIGAPQAVPPLPNVLVGVVDRLSPFPQTEPMHHLVLYALYFLAWAVFMVYWAFRWWEEVPTERFGSTFFYPKLWNYYYALLALVSGFVASLFVFSRRVTTSLPPSFYVTYGVLSVAGWFFWRAVYHRWGRFRELGSKPNARLDTAKER